MRARMWLSLLLCAALLLALPVTAGAAGEPEAAEPTAAETAENVQQLLREAELLREENAHDRSHPETEPRTEGEAELMAERATVNLTVNLPAGVAAAQGDRLYVSFVRQAETDASGKVVAQPANYSSKTYALEPGATSLTVTATLPEGRYFYDLKPRMCTGAVSNRDHYLNGDGTEAADRYVGRGMDVAAGGYYSQSVTLPRAESSISGTVTFSEAPSEEKTMTVSVQSATNGVNYSSGTLTVPAGATSVPFAIGLDKTAGMLRMSIDGSGYAAVDNTIQSTYSYRCYFDASEGPVTGVALNGDALLEEGGSSGSDVRVETTILLPEAVTDWRGYEVQAWYSNGFGYDRWSSDYVEAEAGDESITVTLFMQADTPYAISYIDITGGSSTWNEEPDPGMRFFTETGVSSRIEDAKAFTFSEDTALTLTEPACWKISGSIERPAEIANSDLWAAGIATATFEDGQCWGGRAVFERMSGSEQPLSADYVIYVPKTQAGGFDLSAWYNARGETLPDENSLVDGGHFAALTGDMRAAALTLPEPGSVSGTLSLGEDAAGPQGLAVSVSAGGSGAHYVIPAGKNSVSFALAGYFGSEVSISASAESDKSYGGASAQYDRESTEPCALTLPKLVRVSGTLALPEGLEDAGATVQLRASSTNGSGTTYASFRKSAGSAATWSMLLPKGGKLNQITANVQSDVDGALLKQTVCYLDEDWNTTERSGHGPTVDGPKSGVSLTLGKARVVSGRIVAEDGSAVLIDTETTYGFYFSTNRSSWRSSYLKVAADGSFSAPVPSNISGEVLYLYFYTSSGNDGNILGGEYYYSTQDKALMGRENREQAEAIALDNAGAEGIVLRVQTGWRLNGKVRLAEGGYLKINPGYIIRAGVNAASNGKMYSGHAELISGASELPYSLLVPKEEASYTLTFTPSWDSEYGETNLYFGAQTADTPVTVTADNAIGPDFALPLAKAQIMGKVKRPAGFTEGFSVKVCAEYEGGSVSSNFYLDETASSRSYSFQIAPNVAAETYTLHYTCWANGLEREAWVTADGSLSTDPADAASFRFDAAESVHDITPLPKAPFVQGRIYLPADAEETFDLWLTARNGSSSDSLGTADLFVDPARCASDEKGKYVPYAIYAGDGVTVEQFILRVEGSGSAEVDGSLAYVAGDGTLTLEDGQIRYMTYTGKPVSCDLTLRGWNDGADEYLLQSAHGVAFSGDSEVWTYRYEFPGECESLTLHFSERTEVFGYEIRVRGSEAENRLFGREITVQGNWVEVSMTLYNSYGSRRYGFAVESITPNGVTEQENGIAGAYFTGGGNDSNEVLERLRADEEPLRIAVAGEEGRKAQVLAAVYGEGGKMLELRLVPVTLSSAGKVVSVEFDAGDEIRLLKLFLTDEEGRPLAESVCFAPMVPPQPVQ